MYGEWLFERREFDQSAIGMGDIMAPHFCSLMGCSIYGRAEATESNACIRKGAVMARTLRSHAASEGRRRGSCCDGIPCGRYATSFTIILIGTNDGSAEELSSKKRHTEASQVLLDYAEDVREAVITLVQGNQFSEARRIVSRTNCFLSYLYIVNLQITLNELHELLEEIINPAVLEARNQIREDLTEMREQLQKQVARLRELRIKKAEEPGSLTILYLLTLVASDRDTHAL